MNAPRPYRDEHDLKAMQQVLRDGRKAENGSYYVHTGDLMWWLFYPPLECNYWEHIHLWDDPENTGRLLGWSLISPDWVGIDVYTQPELRGSQEAMEMYAWAEEEAFHVARLRNRKTVSAIWIRHDDGLLVEHFTCRGFRLVKGITHLKRHLEDALPDAVSEHGFTMRGCLGEPEVAARAKAQYGAFSSPVAYERYLERFTNFMRSTVYQPDLDIVAVAPDGQIGAFCLLWLDLVNKVGLFEPVGTHPDFQRKGLGKAVMLEGLRRLQSQGMETAIVSTGEDNLPAIKLYESVGFRVAFKLGTFEKEV